MSNRIDKSWVVFVSIENAEHDRCVDIFSRPTNTYGFEEFRRDPEDCGEWTPISYYSGTLYETADAALAAAERAVPWLARRVNQNPSLRELLKKTPELQIRTLPYFSGT